MASNEDNVRPMRKDEDETNRCSDDGCFRKRRLFASDESADLETTPILMTHERVKPSSTRFGFANRFDESNDESEQPTTDEPVPQMDNLFALSSFLDILFFTKKTFTGADILRHGIRYLCVFLILFLICPYNVFLILLLILVLLFIIVYIVGSIKNKDIYTETIKSDKLSEFKRKLAAVRNRNAKAKYGRLVERDQGSSHQQQQQQQQ